MDDLIQPRSKPKPGRFSSGFKLAREILIIVVSVLLVAVIFRVFFIQMFEISSGSMEETLKIGDRVAVQKVSKIQRGDIVVFRDSNHWLDVVPQTPTWQEKLLSFVGLTADKSANYLIKRVIGMPGDQVSCCDADKRIIVNGYPLNESEYLYKNSNGSLVSPSNMKFDVVVPQGKIFVMGDHRNNSKDSRCYLDSDNDRAFIPLTEVQGSAIAIVLPFEHFRKLSAPEVFAHVPAGKEPPPVAQINEPVPHC